MSTYCRSAATRRGYRMKGYWLPPTNTSDKERCDPRTWDHIQQEREFGYYSHENLLYTDAASTDRDVEVHVLGGLLGVAYRSGFFDLRRLVDFGAWPGGSVFVDDDWISSVLDSSRVPRVVLGLAGSELADQIRNQPLAHSRAGGLNSEAHATRAAPEDLSEAGGGIVSGDLGSASIQLGRMTWVVALAALDEPIVRSGAGDCRNDGNDDVLARYQARNSAVLIKEDGGAAGRRRWTCCGRFAVGRGRAPEPGASCGVAGRERVAALCAELGRGGVVAYRRRCCAYRRRLAGAGRDARFLR